MIESAWNRLLQKIGDGNVVPIIGSRLLVGADGSSIQEKIARKLLEKLLEDAEKSEDLQQKLSDLRMTLSDLRLMLSNVPLTPFRELNDAVFQLRRVVDGEELYDRVHDAMESVLHPKDPTKAVPVPEAIRQLAQIADFRLYVTLTPDDLLAESLRKRCAVNEIIYSPKLPTKEGKDLPSDWLDHSLEVYVLYLFGKLRSSPVFAIHDEDVLEYAHNLIARGSQVPVGFLGELQQRNLLMIGCNFPEWVTRFFLRACNQKRLSENDRRSWLIEPLQAEDNLTIFLRSYSRETEILSQSPPVEFVAELYKRWIDAHGGAQPGAAATAQQPQPPRAMFFISYSRNNLAQAEAIYQALLAQKVADNEVWFDREAIEPGENYQRKILDGIEGCRYFLPVVSLAALSREEGFVFKEWRRATERLEKMHRDFVLPVVVDTEYHPEQYREESVLSWMDQKIDFGFAPNGAPDGRLTKKLQELVRGERLRGAQS